MSNQIFYRKTRPVKSPTRAHAGDAGIDFYVPEDFQETVLAHGESVLIPSGIKINVPSGWMMLMENKSGIGSKKRLDRLACVIDHGYQGEVHFNLVNNGTAPVTISPGEKIIQGILVPVGLAEPMECEDPWYGNTTDRASGGFGSTNW